MEKKVRKSPSPFWSLGKYFSAPDRGLRARF
jgi:hypothetical protein